MFNIIEKTGDVLCSDADIICHQVNCLGIMGGGLALQVKQQYPNVFKEYVNCCDTMKASNISPFGKSLLVPINKNQYICNIFAQLGVGSDKQQTDYGATEAALNDLIKQLPIKKLKIAIPKNIGCGLAGGNWSIIKQIYIDKFYTFSILNNVDVDLEIIELK